MIVDGVVESKWLWCFIGVSAYVGSCGGDGFFSVISKRLKLGQSGLSADFVVALFFTVLFHGSVGVIQ